MVGIADAIRDTLKIVSDPLGRARRSEVFGTYLRLAAQSRRKQPGETAVLGNVIGYLDPSNLLQVFREIFITRLYEMPISSRKPTIVDCGSNVGMSLLYFTLTYPEASIVGFEPNPRAFKVLRENVARNGMKNVCVHQVALGDTIGTVDFFLPKDLGALNAGMYAPAGKQKITVRMERLSSYITGPVDLLKLDIEGAEDLVIEDLIATGSIGLVDNVVMEYHHHLKRGPDALAHTLGLLERAGFSYQLSAYCHHSARKFRQQDILIYAYRNESGKEESVKEMAAVGAFSV